MSARTPEELCSQFTQRFSTGDLDALVALYEPQAVLLPQPGHVARGHAAMRESLEAYDTARFGSLNRQFHELLCSRCDDERLMGMVHQEWLRMDIIRRSAFWYAPGRAVASIAEHEAIIDLSLIHISEPTRPY